jgi:hypothetical protein
MGEGYQGGGIISMKGGERRDCLIKAFREPEGLNAVSFKDGLSTHARKDQFYTT